MIPLATEHIGKLPLAVISSNLGSTTGFIILAALKIYYYKELVVSREQLEGVLWIEF